MKKNSLIFIALCITNMYAQDPIRYIDATSPILETVSPSRDGNDVYHFYYSFNWVNGQTLLSSEMNPQFNELLIYNAESGDIIKRVYLSGSENSKGQVEYQLKKADIKDYKKIKYAVKWEIDKKTDVALSKALIVTFENDPFLKIDISDDGLHYNDNIEIPQIKIKSNKDGTSLNTLTMYIDKGAEANPVATVINGQIKINSNEYTTYTFKPTGLISMSEETNYYLRGKFTNGGFEKELGPVAFKINKREQYQMNPPTGGAITAYGHSDVLETLEASGEIKNVKATLYTSNNGNIDIPIKFKSDNKWEIKIAGDEHIPFGTYKLEFSGQGTNGRPLKTTSCNYVKKTITRTCLQIEYKDKNYVATAKFDSEPSDKVYLVIDGQDVEMKKSLEPKTYSKTFSFDDKVMQDLSDVIKKSQNSQKQILITTKADNFVFPSYVALNAMVIDTDKLKDKSKKEIEEVLKKDGYNEKNAEDLAKTLRREFDKSGEGKKVDKNVWDKVVELAPKAIPLIMMAL